MPCLPDDAQAASPSTMPWINSYTSLSSRDFASRIKLHSSADWKEQYFSLQVTRFLIEFWPHFVDHLVVRFQPEQEAEIGRKEIQFPICRQQKIWCGLRWKANRGTTSASTLTKAAIREELQAASYQYVPTSSNPVFLCDSRCFPKDPTSYQLDENSFSKLVCFRILRAWDMWNCYAVESVFAFICGVLDPYEAPVLRWVATAFVASVTWDFFESLLWLGHCQ